MACGNNANCDDSSNNSPCIGCEDGCINVVLSGCVKYKGDDSLCIGYLDIETDDNLTSVIEALMAAICDLNSRVTALEGV